MNVVEQSRITNEILLSTNLLEIYFIFLYEISLGTSIQLFQVPTIEGAMMVRCF